MSGSVNKVVHVANIAAHGCERRFFHLYGLDRDEAAYVLGTFPIVEREERERWGRFRSRELILGYVAALAAGSPDAAIAG